MLIETLMEVYERDLGKLREEISLYKNEESLWLVKGEIKNTAGNLCLHLVGNLNHFIGAALGKTAYKRDRDSEFALKNILQAELIKKVDDTTARVKNTLSKLSDEDFNKEYPLEFLGKKRTTGYLLVYLLSHFNYHLGQINYHRRL